MKVLVIQLCPTLCNSMDCSSPGSSDHGILQARILEWVSIPFSGDLSNTEISILQFSQSDPLEKETITHSSILAWEIPWTEEPGGL